VLRESQVSLAWASLVLLAGLAAGHAEPGDRPRAYDHAVRDAAPLVEVLRGGPAPDSVDEACRLVFETLAHGEPEPVRLAENWLIWSLGRAWPDLARPQAPLRIATRRRGLCSDSAAVLAAVLRHARYEAEVLGLGGHVVVRATRAGACWIADADLGLVFDGPLEALEHPQGVERVRRAVLAAGYERERADLYAGLLASTDDNRPLAGDFLSPRLARLETALDRLAWIVPAAALLAGAAWALRRRRGSRF
jgi:hypothetical protein